MTKLSAFIALVAAASLIPIAAAAPAQDKVVNEKPGLTKRGHGCGGYKGYGGCDGYGGYGYGYGGCGGYGGYGGCGYPFFASNTNAYNNNNNCYENEDFHNCHNLAATVVDESDTDYCKNSANNCNSANYCNSNTVAKRSGAKAGNLKRCGECGYNGYWPGGCGYGGYGGCGYGGYGGYGYGCGYPFIANTNNACYNNNNCYDNEAFHDRHKSAATVVDSDETDFHRNNAASCNSNQYNTNNVVA